MRTDSAITLVQNVIYRPEWEFECYEHGNFEGAISVKITYPANNFNRENAAGGYTESFRPNATFTIMAGQCRDEVALYRQLIDRCFKVDQHEGREAFRVKPTFWAPFHPHHTDGMERWGDPQADLTFGIGGGS